jgi:hypothetical protein
MPTGDCVYVAPHNPGWMASLPVKYICVGGSKACCGPEPVPQWIMNGCKSEPGKVETGR